MTRFFANLKKSHFPTSINEVKLLNYEIQELENLLKYLAVAIQNRTDGATYVSIFERVEREVEEKRKRISALDRIAALASRQSEDATAISLAA